MIKFENGMLVLDNNATKDDVDAINEYAEHIRKQETERVLRIIRRSAYHKTSQVFEMTETEDAMAEGQIHQYRKQLLDMILK